jgi:putative zinc ribbon protein
MQTQGPFCQSCAMPMEKPEMFGSHADGSISEDYCAYCFQKGTFTGPDISMQEMIDKCVTIMNQREIMPEGQARNLMEKTIPSLSRWDTA